MNSKRLDLFRVEFWWWMEQHGCRTYGRRKRAESDVVHRYGRTIYGDPMFCGGCGDKRYHP
jgi:hypothetical protein